MLKQESSQLLPGCHFFIRISLTWSFLGGWQVGDLPKRFRDDKKSSRARLGLTAHCLITLQGNCGFSCNKKRHWFSSKRNIHMGKSALFISRSLSLLAVIFNEWWQQIAASNRNLQWETGLQFTSDVLTTLMLVHRRGFAASVPKKRPPFCTGEICEKLKSIYSEEFRLYEQWIPKRAGYHSLHQYAQKKQRVETNLAGQLFTCRRAGVPSAHNQWTWLQIADAWGFCCFKSCFQVPLLNIECCVNLSSIMFYPLFSKSEKIFGDVLSKSSQDSNWRPLHLHCFLKR